MDEALELTNAYAPEHLIVETENYLEVAERVINAGSVFLGSLTPESAGDYASGTNHTLPTNGYAKAYSGVSLDSFIRKITFQEILPQGMKVIGPAIEEMAAKLLAKDKNAAIAFLTNYTNMTAQSTFDTWKQLGTFLIVKYNDGVVKRVKDGQFERNSIGQPAGVIRPGYPKEFLEEYVKQTGERYLVK